LLCGFRRNESSLWNDLLDLARRVAALGPGFHGRFGDGCHLGHGRGRREPFGVVANIRAAAKVMPEGERIISIGSGVASSAGFPGLAEYAGTTAEPPVISTPETSQDQSAGRDSINRIFTVWNRFGNPSQATYRP
jgi:hypothetical protein